MAWSIVSSISKLIFTYHGGDEVIENINPPQMTSLNTSRLIANPYPNSGSYYNSARTDGDLALYNAIMALQVGKINLLELATMLNTNETGYLWREEAGRSVRLNIKKYNYTPHGNASISVTASLYGTEYAGTGAGGTAIEKASLGFLYNDTTEKYTLFISQVNDYDFSSYRQAANEANCISNGTSEAYKNYTSIVISALLAGNVPPEPPGPPPTDEPYGDDTYSTSTGGDGDHDDTSDTIAEPALPIMYGSNSGMCTAWVPTIGEIREVAKALVDPNVAQAIWQSVAKLSDVVIGLSLFPCVIDTEPTPQNVKVNFMGVHINTGVNCHLAADQFEEIDCGDITINEYWGNCLDYNPYTRISIYLPFCGMYELDTDEVMGKTINVSYRIDILSGACLATIKVDGSVFYQYSGQCSAQIPLSSVTFDQFIASMVDVGIATATGSKMLGAAGAALSEARQDFNAGKSSSVGGDALMEAKENYQAVHERMANSIADAAVGAVMGQKGIYQHAGALAGSPGFLAVKKPYLIIKRPEQLIPGMYGKFHGFPSNTTAVLGDLVGYTEVGDIRLNIPEATVDEIIECEQLLKGGVVI